MTQCDGPARLGLIRRTAILAAVGLVSVVGLAGCDGERDEPTMVLQPSKSGERKAPPTTAQAPTTRPDDPVQAPLAYISIDGEPHEFPPARLWLTQREGRIKANLFSDDPPEALKANWEGLGFWFEMELERPADAEKIPSGPVSPELLSGAEWVFRSTSSEMSDTPSGIFLGAETQLQPLDVAVSFDPLDERYVIVTLYGTFGQFDGDGLRGDAPQKRVLVQAVLSAEMIRE